MGNNGDIASLRELIALAESDLADADRASTDAYKAMQAALEASPEYRARTADSDGNPDALYAARIETVAISDELWAIHTTWSRAADDHLRALVRLRALRNLLARAQSGPREAAS